MIKMASVDEALSLILEHGRKHAAPPEMVPIANAAGRVLAADAIARTSQPPADVSAMDGYAVRFTDMSVGAQLRIIGESRAGLPSSASIAPGEAMRIFTGAVVPSGADHILIQEDAERRDDVATVTCFQRAPSSIRCSGIDFRNGDMLIPSGCLLRPSSLALIAAGNIPLVSVSRRPRVGVLATGDELVPPGSHLEPGEIVNSIQPAILALIDAWGGEGVDLGVASDQLADVRARIGESEDIIITIGGASVGDYDVVREAFAAEAFEPVFEKVAVKPGKPTWFSVRNNCLALGLPGNPAAALVTANLFLKPLLLSVANDASAGQGFERAFAAVDLQAGGGREEFLRSILTLATDGVRRVRPWAKQDSSLLHPFVSSNALIRRLVDAEPVAVGELVEILMLD